YTATEYSVFLAPGRNGRIYFLGRRERTGVGSGIGYYDLAAKAFGGHHENLNFLEPRGLVVADELGRVVLSGALRQDPSSAVPPPDEAQLVLYDMDLKEVERLTVKPGIKHTGRIFLTSDAGKSNVIVGVIPPERAIYRYDLAQKKLLDWVEINGGIDNIACRETDGAIWIATTDPATRARHLGCLDPATLKWTTFGKLPAAINHLAWSGDDLYVTMTAESGGETKSGLWRLTPPDK
ncbi:MAG TPA: hypothetical protein PK082_04915, partial [Phycisphaerae bacterium]|nr:hypothetical protein [Phycisphaerae bacterium]